MANEIAWINASVGGGPVAFDAVMTGGNSADGDCQQGDNVSSVSTTGITVGASATLLVVPIAWGKTSGSGAPASRSVTWNGVSMTEAIFGSVESTANLSCGIYVLVSPASGAQTLACSWTGTYDCYMGAASFTGTDTSTGINGAHSTTATDVTQITVTSDANGATVAVFCVDGSTPTMNFNKIWDNSAFGPGGGATYQLGGTSNVHTFTGAGGLHQILAGIHIIAP